MKIVYCLQALHRKGGIERVITTKANYLVSAGYEVHIVTTDQRNGPIAFPLDERVQLHDLGLNYELDNNLGRWGRIKALIDKRPKHQSKLDALLREIKADITISTFFQDAPILPKLRDGSKKVLEMHTSRLTPVLMYPSTKILLRALGYIRIWLYERIVRKYDKFVILTQEELPQWDKLDNIVVIPNPRPFTSESFADVKQKRVIAVGRFEYQKNFFDIIDIWSMLPEKFQTTWHLDIYGSGVFEHEYRQKIHNLGLSKTISLYPSTSEIQQKYLEHSIYCLTSHYEGLPMVLLEAQALGLPIVSYACPSGPKDIVDDGRNGFLVRIGDKEEFVRKLVQLCQSEELRRDMGIQSKVASNKFALEKVMLQWEQLFKLLGSHER